MINMFVCAKIIKTFYIDEIFGYLAFFVSRNKFLDNIQLKVNGRYFCNLLCFAENVI